MADNAKSLETVTLMSKPCPKRGARTELNEGCHRREREFHYLHDLSSKAD